MNNNRSWTEINLTNFEHNFKELRKFIPSKTHIMQIVKADAYGHGAFEIARKAIKNGADFLGVANAEEGLLLRYQGISAPILILSPSLEHEIEIILENNLTPSISSLDFAQKFSQQASTTQKIHINIDTGMGRSGICYTEAPEVIQNISRLPNIEIEGIFSHFAAAENDPQYTQLQIERFQTTLAKLDFKPAYTHISNSSGVITADTGFTNLVRLGLVSYGVYPDPSMEDKILLKPVMSFKSQISQIKTALKGDPIGYNRTFIAPELIKYAILPIGYADGYDFLLSNRGKVLLHNTLCNVIGKISMDMIAIDISGLSDVKIGDTVTLLGNKREIRAENLTALYGGSFYELLCQIGRRAKRFYKENGKIIASSPLLRRNFIPTDYSDKKLNNIIEAAIEQRLQSKEIASLISEGILKQFFAERDRDIYYRRNFNHSISFANSDKYPDYYFTRTTLTFTKKLQNNYFYVACANSEAELEKYFLRNDVEYRWRLDKRFDLNNEFFNIESVKVDDIELNYDVIINDDSMEIRCSHPKLAALVDKEVNFSISTQTYYPKESRNLNIYIIEMTQGVTINFEFDHILEKVEAVPIFSGRSKFPQIKRDNTSITISSRPDEWIFPTSGIVFIY